MAEKILILEDEDSIRKLVAVSLGKAGYEVLECGTCAQALACAEQHADVAIALLDVMLPDGSGFDVCTQLRSKSAAMGIIMLTALSRESDKIRGFAGGADDYVPKPFSLAELTARVEALYRRVTGAAGRKTVLTSGDFVLDQQKRELRKNGVRIELTQVEYQMMQTFLENPGRRLSRQELLHAVWGSVYEGNEKVVDVNVRRLRLKIEDDPAEPRCILTLWGFGYQWQA